MAVKPYLVQRRMRELGRVRLGEKGPKGEPRKLQTLRFTSFSLPLLEALAAKHGGKVRPWQGAPEEGAFEVVTETNRIDIILPPVFSAADGSPTTAYSQFFELWSAGGCLRRCDGETDSISGKPCLCNPEERECQLTTRVSFMLPDIPDIGVWRLDTKGWNAAVELPGTLEVLLLAAAEHKFIPAVLRVEPRTKKVPGEGTRRFVVPVIEMPGVTVRQLASGDVPLAINSPAPPPRPALPVGTEPPAEPEASRPEPGWGEEPTPGVASAEPIPPRQGGGAAFQPQNAEDGRASGAAPPQRIDDALLIAPERDIAAFLEAAGKVGAEAHTRAVEGVAKNRLAHGGHVDADWLARQRAKLDALLPAEPAQDGGESEGGSLFAGMAPREYQQS